MIAYYVSLFLLPLGDAVTIGLINPPIVTVVAHYVFKEPLGWFGLAGCFMSLSGVVVLAHPPFLFGGHAAWGAARLVGTVAGLASSLLAAGAYMCIKMIGQSEPAAVVALWFHTATMVLCILPLGLGMPDKAVAPIPGDVALMLGVAVTSFAAQLLMTRGFQTTAAAIATAMSFTSVLYSYVLGALFFGEQMSLMGGAGTLFILTGVFMVTMRNSNQTKQQQPNARPQCAATAGYTQIASHEGCDSLVASSQPCGSHPAQDFDMCTTKMCDTCSAKQVIKVNVSAAYYQPISSNSTNDDAAQLATAVAKMQQADSVESPSQQQLIVTQVLEPPAKSAACLDHPDD